ncbi:MAG: class IV adenylate cyclase [Thermoplasmatota archaeon]
MQKSVYETEVKLCIDGTGWERLLTRLEELGAPAGAATHQADTLLAHPCRDLKASGEALRIRLSEGRHEVTYKGPVLKGAGKAREEVAFEASVDPAPLLHALGFTAAVSVRKTRRRTGVAGVEVLLDDVEGLGRFVELEVVGPDPEAARRRIAEARTLLGLASLVEETKSYAELVATT